jgi:protein-tyrosine phosphatase
VILRIKPGVFYNAGVYRLGILERLLHDFLARFLSRLGLARRIYLGPVLRLKRSPTAPLEIAFVCQGNICRSPYAEAQFRRKLERAGADGFAVSSAGLDTTDGKAANPNALECAAERGIDLSEHTTHQFTAAMAERADLIVVMEPRHLRQLRALSPAGRSKAILLGAPLLDRNENEKLTTPDPYGQPAAVFSAYFDKIDRAAAALLEELTTGADRGREPGRWA